MSLPQHKFKVTQDVVDGEQSPPGLRRAAAAKLNTYDQHDSGGAPSTRTGLMHYDRMRHELETCANTDEALEIRQRARAAEIYAKQVNDTNAERQLATIRLRAERRLGELLQEMKQTGQREDGRQTPRNRRSTDATVSQPATLAQIGITKDQSSKFQQLADVPREQFEKAVSGSSAIPTTEGVINRAKQHRPSSADVSRNGSGSLGTLPPAQWVRAQLLPFDTTGIILLNPADIFAQMSQHELRDVTRVIRWLETGIGEACKVHKVAVDKIAQNDPRQMQLPSTELEPDRNPLVSKTENADQTTPQARRRAGRASAHR